MGIYEGYTGLTVDDLGLPVQRAQGLDLRRYEGLRVEYLGNWAIRNLI